VKFVGSSHAVNGRRACHGWSIVIEWNLFA